MRRRPPFLPPPRQGRFSSIHSAGPSLTELTATAISELSPHRPGSRLRLDWPDQRGSKTHSLFSHPLMIYRTLGVR